MISSRTKVHDCIERTLTNLQRGISVAQNLMFLVLRSKIPSHILREV